MKILPSFVVAVLVFQCACVALNACEKKGSSCSNESGQSEKSNYKGNEAATKDSKPPIHASSVRLATEEFIELLKERLRLEESQTMDLRRCKKRLKKESEGLEARIKKLEKEENPLDNTHSY